MTKLKSLQIYMRNDVIGFILFVISFFIDNFNISIILIGFGIYFVNKKDAKPFEESK